MSNDLIFTQRFLPEIGGSVTFFYNICRFFNKTHTLITHKYNNKTVVVSNFTKHITENLLMNDWGLRTFDSLTKYYKAFKLIDNNISKETFIHCSHILPEGLPSIVSKFFNKNVKVIAYIHGEELLAYKSSRELMLITRFVVSNIDLFICVSNSTKDLLYSTFKISSDKVVVINPSIHLDDYIVNESKIELRKELNLDSQKTILISVARLTKKKNHIKIIEAIANLQSQNIDYIIVGDGEEKKNLQTKVEELQLHARVHFMTDVDEHKKIMLLAASDIYVMPSIKIDEDLEGFGIAYLEAQAMGLPVLAGNSGGESDAISDKTGIVVNGNNLEEVTNGLKTLIENREFYSRNTKEFVKNFSTEKFFSKLHDAYKKII